MLPRAECYRLKGERRSIDSGSHDDNSLVHTRQTPNPRGQAVDAKLCENKSRRAMRISVKTSPVERSRRASARIAAFVRDRPEAHFTSRAKKKKKSCSHAQKDSPCQARTGDLGVTLGYMCFRAKTPQNALI